MKLHLEAQDATELRTKGPELLAQLAKAFAPHDPHTADLLEKAASHEHKERKLKHKALREGVDTMQDAYQAMLQDMLKEMGQALDQHIDQMAKSESPDYTEAFREKDEAAYQDMQTKLAVHGYTQADFIEPTGMLYGMNIPELQGLLKELQDQKAT